MAEHLALKADLYEQKYRDLPLAIPDDRWRAILDLAQFALDRPIADLLDGPLVPLVAAERKLSAAVAATPVFQACLAECEVERRSSQISERFWSALTRATYGDLGDLWQRLGGDGAPGFLAYDALLGTVGVGGSRPAKLPWWMGDSRHRNGAFAGAKTVGLLTPGALRALVKAARANSVIEIVTGFFQEQSSDPAAAPQVIEAHVRLVAFLESAALRGDWVLGMEG